MSFSKDIANWSKEAKGRAEKVRRGVTLKLFSAVILDTPVLSGRARGNWRVSIGEPDLSVSEAEDPSGQRVISEVSQAVAKSTGDVIVNLSNSLPYIERLENGYSQKAPEGMVRKNAARFLQLVQTEARQ